MKPSGPSIPKRSHAARDELARGRSEASARPSGSRDMRERRQQSTDHHGDEQFERFASEHPLPGTATENHESKKAMLRVPTHAASGNLEGAWQKAKTSANLHPPQNASTGPTSSVGTKASAAPKFEDLGRIVFNVTAMAENFQEFETYPDPFTGKTIDYTAVKIDFDRLGKKKDTEQAIYRAANKLTLEAPEFMRFLANFPTLSTRAEQACNRGSQRDSQQALDTLAAETFRQVASRIDCTFFLEDMGFGDRDTDEQLTDAVHQAIVQWAAKRLALPSPPASTDTSLHDGTTDVRSLDPIGGFAFLVSTLSELMPTARGVQEQDLGVLLGLFCRTYLRAIKDVNPQLDDRAYARQLHEHLTSFLADETDAGSFGMLISPRRLPDPLERFRCFVLFEGFKHTRDDDGNRMTIDALISGLFDGEEEFSVAQAAKFFDEHDKAPGSSDHRLERRAQFIELCSGWEGRLNAQPRSAEKILERFRAVLGLEKDPDLTARL